MLSGSCLGSVCLAAAGFGVVLGLFPKLSLILPLLMRFSCVLAAPWVAAASESIHSIYPRIDKKKSAIDSSWRNQAHGEGKKKVS